MVGVAQADGGEGGAGFLDLRLVIAQLRDMVAAEDSPIVAQEDQHRGSVFPQRTEADFLAVWIREFNPGFPIWLWYRIAKTKRRALISGAPT